MVGGNVYGYSFPSIHGQRKSLIIHADGETNPYLPPTVPAFRPVFDFVKSQGVEFIFSFIIYDVIGYWHNIENRARIN